MTLPNITVSVDTSDDSYTFVTDPYVKPGDEPLPVDRLGSLTLKAGGAHSNITVVATVYDHATVTAPFDPALQPATTTSATYQLTAIGGVTLTVPSYGGRPLTGTALEVVPTMTFTLEASAPSSYPVSFGAQILLRVYGITEQVLVTVPEGLFIGQSGGTVPVDPDGTLYQIDDVENGAYECSYVPPQQGKMTTPLVGTINVSSTKKPHM